MGKIGDTLNNLPIKTACIAVFTLNFVMRGWFATAHPVWGDEAYSLYFSQFTLSNIKTVLMAGYNPPLFEIILHFCQPLPIEHPMLFRWFSVLCVSLAGAILFGPLFHSNKKTAWLFGSLFLSSCLVMNMSQFLRVYALEILLISVVYNGVQKKNLSYARLIILAFLCALLLYLHYVSVILIPFIIGYFALQNLSLKKWGIFLITLLVSCSPILNFLIIKMTNGSVNEIKQSTAFSLENLLHLSGQVFNGLSFYFFIACIVIGLHLQHQKKLLFSAPVILGALPFITLMLVGLIYPVADRYFSLFLPLFLLAISVATISLIESTGNALRKMIGIIYLIFNILFILQIDIRFPYNDYPNRTADILKPYLNNYKIIISPQYIALPLMFHLSQSNFKSIQWVEEKIQSSPNEHYQFYSRAAYKSFEEAKVFFINNGEELPPLTISDSLVIWVDSHTEEINPHHGIEIKLQQCGYQEMGWLQSDWKTKVHFYQMLPSLAAKNEARQ